MDVVTVDEWFAIQIGAKKNPLRVTKGQANGITNKLGLQVSSSSKGKPSRDQYITALKDAADSMQYPGLVAGITRGLFNSNDISAGLALI